MKQQINIGFALCGSFCTFEKSISQLEHLVSNGYNVYPIMSFNAANLDTKFGKACDFKEKIKNITKKEIINSIVDAEPIGPKKMLDALVICPCTGNTLSKLANAVTDTPVTMAAKSHLRINRPVIIAIASNDSLAASAQNIGKLINTKNIYFVPFNQDDSNLKPNSLVSNFELLEPTIVDVLENKKQYQPIIFK